jgi:hypothetical protein
MKNLSSEQKKYNSGNKFKKKTKSKENLEKVLFSKTDSYIDVQTGELIKETKYEEALVQKEPKYVKIYFEDIARINDLPPAAGKLLNLLVQSMGYNNMVPLMLPFKQMICNQLDIKINTLEKMTKTLVEKGILYKFARSLYILDPHLFAKGKWEDISQLRLIIDYDPITGERRLSSNAPEQIKQLSIKFD